MAQAQNPDQQQDQGGGAPGGGDGGGGGGIGGVAQDFTQSLEGEAPMPGAEGAQGTEPGAETGATPTGIPGGEEEETQLKENMIKSMLLNRRKTINENISKTLNDIDKMLNE